MKGRGRVLILDGHTNQALACVRSLGRAGYAVMVASHKRLPLCAWSRYCKATFHLSGETTEAFARLRSWSRRHGIDIVLPITERSCLLCNAERQEWEASGITIGCGPDEMLAWAFDKAKTFRLASDCGLSSPPTRVPMSLEECREAAREVGYPCVVKPRWSNARSSDGFLPTKGPKYVADEKELERAVLDMRQGDYWPLIQGYVPGKGKGYLLYVTGGVLSPGSPTKDYAMCAPRDRAAASVVPFALNRD